MSALTRRIGILGILAIFALVALTGCGRSPEPPRPNAIELPRAPWESWKSRFLEPEGRVVDDGQKGITHSEGQAFALLLATAHDDRATFERVWSWTAQELAVREDALLAWRWEPQAQGGRVTDRNNATDADLIAAWALVRAHERWGQPVHRERAKRMAEDLRAAVVREGPQGPLLLPGAYGFEKPEGPVVNLSYWVFPAFAALHSVDDSPTWPALERSGLALLSKARFGAASLPPDWLGVRGQELVPAPGFAPRFGYDAVRVPLYLVWDERRDPALLSPFARFWKERDAALPAWIDLETGATGERAPPGFLAVRDLVARALGSSPAKASGSIERPKPTAASLASGPVAQDSYYSSSLALLAQVAAAEGLAP